MSDLDLNADLVTRKLISSDGGAVTLPTLVLGDRLHCTLRTYERSEAGDLRERDLKVRTLHASIGKVMEAPGDGEFTLRVGGHETGAIAAKATAEQFRAALGTHDGFTIEELLSPTGGCWLMRLGGGDPVPVELVTNLLRPTSFVRLRAFQQTGRWWHEVRLIQAPLSFNDGHERVLPAPPTVRRIRDGKGSSDTEPGANELQALHLPPDFRGTYFLRWNFHISKLLGIQDGPDEIAAALNAMFSSGKRFEATNPEPDNAYIEFINALGEAPQPPITVEVNTFAPGVLNFTLPLDYAEIVLDFPLNAEPPALNSLALTLSTAGPRSAFQAHTHTMAQIIGLLDALLTIYARLETIEDLLPSIVPALRDTSSKEEEIPIPPVRGIFPGIFPPDFDPAKAITGAGLRAAPFLLPAIHDATVANVPIPIDAPAAHVGEVFVNNTAAIIPLPGGPGRRTSIVPVNGHLGSDVRAWYWLTRDGTTNSFFPSEYERELFLLPFNDSMLRAGQAFNLSFKLAVAVIKASTKAQMLLRIEVGSVPAQSTPAPTGDNLENVVWLETPLLSRRLVLSSVLMTHDFGCAIRRDALGNFTADRLLYGRWEGAAQAPVSPNFVLRARLMHFDTENSVPNARGFVFFEFSNAKASLS